jgi:hypothetical protein
MNAWAVDGVELPFGDQAGSWWIDVAGSVRERPIAGADPLPGRFFLTGLVDAHAHPAIGIGPAGFPVPLDESAARANLIGWAKTGITQVRDVGSAGGMTLRLTVGPGMPVLQAAGRFLARRAATTRTCWGNRWPKPTWSAVPSLRSAGERRGSR